LNLLPSRSHLKQILQHGDINHHHRIAHYRSSPSRRVRDGCTAPPGYPALPADRMVLPQHLGAMAACGAKDRKRYAKGRFSRLLWAVVVNPAPHVLGAWTDLRFRIVAIRHRTT